MLQNPYTLAELIDLALIIPEVGAVNFNIIHTILHTIVKELELENARPSCLLENPLLARTQDIRAKLKGVAHKRAPTTSKAHSRDKEQSKSKEGALPAQVATTEPPKELPEKSSTTEETQPSAAVSDIGSTDDSEIPPTVTEKDESKPETEKDESKPETEKDESKPETEKVESKPETEKDESKPDQSATAETAKRPVKAEEHYEAVPTREPTPKPEQFEHTTADYWNYENLQERVLATEETISIHADILNNLLDSLRKKEKRKTEGGPSSEELEALDERLLELEEAMARLAADHELLMELERILKDIQREFESIKALAAMLEQMQLDISKKADKEETWAALASKADLELVNTKVDQLEFETAIEELGEAIGLLGIKFVTKNDEWEERAAEIWRGIDSKMSRDIFDVAVAKINSRLTALMYGLKKLKKVVEDLLYPEASGVTRCIICRRPACISGLECFEMCGSPKRPLSDRSSEDEDPTKLTATMKNVIAKKQKLDAPPYPKTKDTILILPYSSSSYRSSVDEKPERGIPSMKLMPVVGKRNESNQAINSKSNSQIPKLPKINEANSCLRSSEKKSLLSVRKPIQTRIKLPKETPDEFCNRIRNERRDRIKTSTPEKSRDTTAVEPPEKGSSRRSSAKSTKSIEVTPDPDKTLNEFTPARLMTDTLRRDIIVSPTSPKECELSMTFEPLQFDTESNKRLSPK